MILVQFWLVPKAGHCSSPLSGKGSSEEIVRSSLVDLATYGTVVIPLFWNHSVDRSAQDKLSFPLEHSASTHRSVLRK